MGAVEQRPVEETTLFLRVAYRRPEELIADDLRWFSAGRLPPLPPDVLRLELDLELQDGPALRLSAERDADGPWRLHPGGDAERQAYRDAMDAIARKALGISLASRLAGLSKAGDEVPPSARATRHVSEVGRRAPK